MKYIGFSQQFYQTLLCLPSSTLLYEEVIDNLEERRQTKPFKLRKLPFIIFPPLDHTSITPNVLTESPGPITSKLNLTKGFPSGTEKNDTTNPEKSFRLSLRSILDQEKICRPHSWWVPIHNYLAFRQE